MLASQPPHTPHTPYTRPLPPISHPISPPRPSSQTTIIALASPPQTPPRARRPSLSNTMHWLSRSPTQSSSTSSPYAPTKPLRISEPKLVRSIEVLSQRSGILGSGATVVRTPDEALKDTTVRLTFDGKPRNETPGEELEDEALVSAGSDSSEGSHLQDKFHSPPNSPPLPPLPFPGERESRITQLDSSSLSSSSSSCSSSSRSICAPPRYPPPPPPSLCASSKMISSINAEDVPRVPPLPANIVTSPPLPAFKPILVSEVPTSAIDSSKIIVTLETCTASHRTTLDTLMSRPSHLSSYISSLFRESRSESDGSSVYSNTSDMSTFRHHLISQGLLPKALFTMHIFLDRPSGPYSHILAHLRSPLPAPDVPETFPRAAQLQTASQSRLEALLELRDEAAYLGLEGLHKLCIDELRQRHSHRLHTRGHSSSSSGSVHSLHASIYGLHTLLERVENDLRLNQPDSKAVEIRSVQENDKETAVRSPPTPVSWNERGRARSQSRQSSVRSPPAGWI